MQHAFQSHPILWFGLILSLVGCTFAMETIVLRLNVYKNRENKNAPWRAATIGAGTSLFFWLMVFDLSGHS